MPVHRARVNELITFAREHESEVTRDGDLAAQKSAMLTRLLGPHADAEVTGPMTTPGRVNGIVVHEGDVVAEFGDTTFVDEIASATKSFLGLVAGVAVDDGLIADVDGRVADRVDLAEFESEHNRRITWRQLLNQTSEWNGTLFGKVPTGHRGERIGEPLREPGAFWEYNDVRVNLLARALLEVFGRPLPEVLDERVMAPVGASSTWSWHGYDTSSVKVDGRLVESVSGGSHWGGGIWMSSRDLALVGRLMLARGWWNGRPVISESWIDALRTPCSLNPMYGMMWWLQHDATGRQVCHAAQGGGSHQCFVIPDHDLVVVVRWIRDDAWPEFLDRALTVVSDRPPLGPVRYRFDEVNTSAVRAGPSSSGVPSSVRAVAEAPFVPIDFEPPTTLQRDRFRLEPLGPQHNQADHAAWTSSIAHIRSTPGFPDGSWPPPEGMSLDQNLADLRRHAADFDARTGFTFTVLDTATGDVIGCVYLYPSESPDADVTAQSWVRSSHAELDVPLADAVAAWLAAEWPWERVHRPGR